MKSFFVLFLGFALMACQQTIPNQPKPLAAFEITFDLDNNSARVKQSSGLQVQASLTSSQIGFTAPNTLGFVADTARGVNYLSATFQVSNNTASALQDLTLVAYHKSGNAANTAIKSIVDFNSTPLNATQLAYFARAIQPVNMPSSLTPSFTVNDSIADVQYLQESELSSLASLAVGTGELNNALGEFLFPYGFVARSSNNSRSIPVGTNTGTITLAVKLPNNNEPTAGNPRRFTMTFLAFDQPFGSGPFGAGERMTESYEERNGTSSAATRASGFGITNNLNLARNTVTNVANSLLISGVRTAGSANNPLHLLGERAWQFGTSALDETTDMALDSSGNVYVVGYTRGAFPTFSNAGLGDAFIAKYSPTGTQLWVRQFGTNQTDNIAKVAVGSDGFIYVAGNTQGTLGNSNFGGFDGFIAKYNSSGTQQWIQQFGTGSDESINSIALDSSNNIYVVGSTKGAFIGTNQGADDAFVIKYNSGGTQIWVRQFGTTLTDISMDIVLDSSTSIFIVGFTFGTFQSQSSSGFFDVFIAKFDSTGSQTWLTQFGTNGEDRGFHIALDNTNQPYVLGETDGDFQPPNGNVGGRDIFVAKYNSSNGSRTWIRQFGTSGTDNSGELQIDSSNNLFLVGSTQGAFAGNTNAGSPPSPPTGDAFISKYTSTGTQVLVKQFGTTGGEGVGGAAINSSGHLFIAGGTNSAFAGFSQLGAIDAYIARIDTLGNLYY